MAAAATPAADESQQLQQLTTTAADVADIYPGAATPATPSLACQKVPEATDGLAVKL